MTAMLVTNTLIAAVALTMLIGLRHRQTAPAHPTISALMLGYLAVVAQGLVEWLLPDVKDALHLSRNLVNFVAVSFIGFGVLSLTLTNPWAKAIWGKGLLGLMACFELFRRFDWALQWQTILWVITTGALLLVAWKSRGMAKAIPLCGLLAGLELLSTPEVGLLHNLWGLTSFLLLSTVAAVHLLLVRQAPAIEPDAL
ncbi:hypothetical protein QCD60_16530 [Pokkaliibacter sp. MBI-7]|uniref:hypothetical protein n=1 Tax=Pokkaliibacter sp. MBI-7 TaxID=3040600 RepID=UPI002447ED29|nr:hypothetical protein [Pokkaliibacter sp. MBI-7]MDH2434169.1 hypothetical protein [Pokkaliibacter sp. MBI-7]